MYSSFNYDCIVIMHMAANKLDEWGGRYKLSDEADRHLENCDPTRHIAYFMF